MMTWQSTMVHFLSNFEKVRATVTVKPSFWLQTKGRSSTSVVDWWALWGRKAEISLKLKRLSRCGGRSDLALPGGEEEKWECRWCTVSTGTQLATMMPLAMVQCPSERFRTRTGTVGWWSSTNVLPTARSATWHCWVGSKRPHRKSPETSTTVPGKTILN